jgi:hypothetical protein
LRRALFAAEQSIQATTTRQPKQNISQAPAAPSSVQSTQV